MFFELAPRLARTTNQREPSGDSTNPNSTVMSLPILALITYLITYSLCASASYPGGVRSTDEVKLLPGWDGPLPSRMFSGFIDSTPAGESKPQHMHYIFVESENDPSSDPVLIWSNGGPGVRVCA
jgi:carboxypeptidase C (cathepsin A)